MKKSRLIRILLYLAAITVVTGAFSTDDQDKRSSALINFGGNLLSAGLALVASEREDDSSFISDDIK